MTIKVYLFNVLNNTCWIVLRFLLRSAFTPRSCHLAMCSRCRYPSNLLACADIKEVTQFLCANQFRVCRLSRKHYEKPCLSVCRGLYRDASICRVFSRSIGLYWDKYSDWLRWWYLIVILNIWLLCVYSNWVKSWPTTVYYVGQGVR